MSRRHIDCSLVFKGHVGSDYVPKIRAQSYLENGEEIKKKGRGMCVYAVYEMAKKS